MDGPKSQIYEFDEFRIDVGKRQLSSGSNGAIPLTSKAFDTLVYLAANGGRVIGKSELIDAVWPDAVVEENNLNQSIAALRRAFGERPGEQRFIVTVSGHGYRFVPQVHKREQQHVENPARGSIAILPFKPLVAHDRDEALEMGMADTLISRLGGNSLNVVVRPLASVRQYGNLDQDPLIAGRELNVQSVLDGSIQHAGEKIRMNVSLLRTDDGVSLWAGTFDEAFTDILAVQDSISQRVAAALQTRLGADRSKRSTENVEAYQLYLKGRYHVGKLTAEGLRNGIASFQQAIVLDPAYALAYTGLADAFLRISIAGELPAHEFFPKSIAAGQSALDIAPELCEPHVVLGWTNFWYDWDWNLSESYLRKALKIDPHNPDALEAYAHLLSNTGRHTEAIAMIGKAREINPLSLFVHAMEGQFLLHSGLIDDAIVKLRETIDLEPRFWLTHFFLARALLEKADLAEAEREAAVARGLSEGSTHALAVLVFILAKAGRAEDAEALVNELLELSKQSFVPPYHLATAYLGLGNVDQALLHLEIGYQKRDPKMVFLKVEPTWNSIRSDERFEELLNRMNLD